MHTLGAPMNHVPAEGMPACYLARVVSVKDDDGLTRIQVRLLNYDGVATQDGPIWARVALPFAGSKRGVFMLPDVDDEVLVQFVNGDSRFPVIVGGLWSGNAKPPDSLGGDGSKVDRWVIVSKGGSKIAITEPDSGQPTISFATPGGVTGKLTDDSAGQIELSLPQGTSTITMDSSGVSIQTGGKFSVQATEVEINSGTVTVNSSVSTFSDMVQCETHLATTIVASTYTPGAGNVW